MHSHPHSIPLHPLCGILCTASDSYDSILYPHRHEACELSLMLGGVHAVDLETTTIELPAGGLILLRSGESHGRRMVSPGRYLTIAFPLHELERLDRYLEDDNFKAVTGASTPPCARLHTPETEQLARRIERVNLLCSANPLRARTEMRALLVDCWSRYFVTPDAGSPERVPWLSRLLREMTLPDNTRRGLSAMLNLAPYSHEYLCREFRRLMGCTPTEYVNSLRLDRAHTLLETTSLSIADICYEVGFESVSYFHQLFRSKYAITPARYRKTRFISRPTPPPEQAS